MGSRPTLPSQCSAMLHQTTPAVLQNHPSFHGYSSGSGCCAGSAAAFEPATQPSALPILLPWMQGQQRKIAELEAQLAAVVVRLEESERARRAAEERVRELSSEVGAGGAGGQTGDRAGCLRRAAAWLQLGSACQRS